MQQLFAPTIQHLMDSDFGFFFPIQYDWYREVQHLVSFMTDWIDTQQLYSPAFGLNPTDLSSSGVPLSNNDYETFISGISVACVSHSLAT